MAVEDERTALRIVNAMTADDVEGVVVVHMHRRETRKSLDVLDLDQKTIDREAAPAHLGREEVLRRVLGTTHRGKPHELRRQLDLVVETRIHGFHDCCGHVLIEHSDPSSFALLMVAKRRLAVPKLSAEACLIA